MSIFLFLLLLFTSVTTYSQYSKVPGSFDKTYFHLLPPYKNTPLDTVKRVDFTVTMRDGVKIDCLKFIPLGSPPQGGWPTVIMVHGYGDNKETLAGFCKSQAEYGYYTMTFSVRGQGMSGGLSNLISNVEMLDLLELINYVKKDTVNGAGPDRILIMGGSQGGVLPYRAACNGAQVKTIITSVAPPDFASSWIENGSIKMTFLWSIDYPPDTARYTNAVERMRYWVYEDTKNAWDSLAYWLPKDRDFMNEVHECSVPLLVEGSWQDKFFNASGIMDGLSKLNTPFISYLGAVQGHGGDHSDTEDLWHMKWFNDWFFFWLFNEQNGILNQPKYQYASSMFPIINNYWTFAHDSSRIPLKEISTNLRLYFNKNERLSTAAGGTDDTINLINCVSGGLTMQEAVNEEFTGATFNSKFRKEQLVFDTDPFTARTEFTGIPKINVQYQSSSNTFVQLNYQLYEIKSDGTSRFITRANYTDRVYTANNMKKSISFKGQGHSHIISAGSKLRVVITNLDTAPTDTVFLKTNPFVLPVLANSTHTIYLNSFSYIDLPVVQNINTGTSEFFNEGSKNIPGEFVLEQNYPNPFNPVTTISYTLPKAVKAELRVYDILGREVQVLVNEFQQAGKHNVYFNASGLSSGVYFYRLISDGFSDIKRMVLVK